MSEAALAWSRDGSNLQVCEVYKLHRETYYLAIDFVDRYLSKTYHEPKTRLQLVGITALFAAAKLEVPIHYTCVR